MKGGINGSKAVVPINIPFNILINIFIEEAKVFIILPHNETLAFV